MPADQRRVTIPDHHPGYITSEQFVANRDQSRTTNGRNGISGAGLGSRLRGAEDNFIIVKACYLHWPRWEAYQIKHLLGLRQQGVKRTGLVIK
jgi:hypothetical protein